MSYQSGPNTTAKMHSMVVISFTQRLKGYNTMDYQLEKHLREMGILPTTTIDELMDSVPNVYQPFIKDCFNDPRDPITGEVPF